MELREDAPCAVAACLLYFQERYIGHWSRKITQPQAIVAYLQTQGFELTVTQYELPNRKDWYYELYAADQLVQHARNFTSYQEAAAEAIRIAFLKLEQ